MLSIFFTSFFVVLIGSTSIPDNKPTIFGNFEDLCSLVNHTVNFQGQNGFMPQENAQEVQENGFVEIPINEMNVPEAQKGMFLLNEEQMKESNFDDLVASSGGLGKVPEAQEQLFFGDETKELNYDDFLNASGNLGDSEAPEKQFLLNEEQRKELAYDDLLNASGNLGEVPEAPEKQFLHNEEQRELTYDDLLNASRNPGQAAEAQEKLFFLNEEQTKEPNFDNLLRAGLGEVLVIDDVAEQKEIKPQ